jgi:TP901 family phage tail tape measure protein
VANKVYEISFSIAGKMASGFGNTFTFASSRVQQLNTEIKQLNSQFKKGDISVDEYAAKQSKLARKIRETQAAQELLNRSLKKQRDLTSSMSSAALGSVRNTLSVGAGAVAVGGGFILGSSIKKAMDYEAQLSSIQALTGINNNALKKMDDLALKMGADTKYSALQAAQGIEELLKAGMSPAIVQAGGLEAALNLATAGGLDLTESAVTMSDALNGFKKDGNSAADVANILAGAANASSTDVHKLSESLQAVGPVGDLLGAKFRSINGVLAAFSNNNLKGSDAGTSLKTMLMNLQPQTKEATSLFHKYGLTAKNGANSFFQANGELKDMADVAGILHTQFKNLNDQQRADAFYNLFGSDAVRAASILYKEGAEGIKKMYSEMSDVTALEVAKKKMDNAAGSVEQFKGALETLQIRALRPTLPIIKKVFDQAGNVVEKWTPRITKAVHDAVNDSSGYLRTHFINNPEFQKLSTTAKIGFVFDDLWKTFSAWYDSTGSGYVSNVTAKLTAGLAAGIIASAGPITESGLKLGGALAEGIWQGLQDFMAEHPVLAVALGAAAGAAAGSKAGPWGALVGGAAGAVGVSVGGAGARSEHSQNEIHNVFDDFYAEASLSSGIPMDRLRKMPQGDPQIQKMMNDWFMVLSSGSGVPVEKIKGYEEHNNMSALGDVINKMSPGYLQMIDKKLNEQSSGQQNVVNNITYAPVINGMDKKDIEPALKQHQQDFASQFDALMKQKWRVSFAK